MTMKLTKVFMLLALMMASVSFSNVDEGIMQSSYGSHKEKAHNNKDKDYASFGDCMHAMLANNSKAKAAEVAGICKTLYPAQAKPQADTSPYSQPEPSVAL